MKKRPKAKTRPKHKKPRDRFQRTVCSCRACTALCKTMPGYLLPGDAERIAQYLGMSLEDLQDYLLASPGAIVMGPSAFGRVRKRIRTIVPAQNEDGSCVFLNGEDRCSIHSAAPYGCGWFDTHQSQEQGEERSYEGLITITEQANNSPYKTLWRRLEEKGRVAKSVQSRRETADTVVREATRSAEKGVDE